MAKIPVKKHPQYVWVLKNGSIRLHLMTEAEIEAKAFFVQFTAWLCQGVDAYPQLAEEWQRLDDRKGLDLKEPLIRIAAKLNALLAVIDNPPATEKSVTADDWFAQNEQTDTTGGHIDAAD